MQRKLPGVMTAVVLLGLLAATACAEPKNVIIIIGDGMGFEQVRAAGMYLEGQEGTLSFEALPHQGELTTYSADSSITDGAAAATALATGQKVDNGVISQAIPGDNSELYTILEYCRDQGKSTGLVSTASMTDATAAAFAAHEIDRSRYWHIADDYLTQSRPNVMFGGGGNGLTIARTEAEGYTVVTSRTEMDALSPSPADHISGQFGQDHLPYEYDWLSGAHNGYELWPHLSEMAAKALDILDDNPSGFFLMIEAARIDHACHANHLRKSIFETAELDDTVQAVMAWARNRRDTLVVVTADHETGGLTVLQNNGQGAWPTVSWATGGHTAANVPVYAWGVNAELISGLMDNTELFAVATADRISASVDLERDWVYQNTVSTLANGGHKVRLEVTVFDGAGNDSVTVSVAKVPGSGSGEVVIQDDPAGDPLVKYIVGSTRSDGIAGTGPLTLAVTVTGNIDGQVTLEVPFVSRALGDIDGNGAAEPGDVNDLIMKLNGKTPAGYEPLAFDLDGNGAAEPADVMILMNVLNSQPVP